MVAVVAPGPRATRYWHRSPTAACSATSVRAAAVCARASAASASCARARATPSCSPPTGARAGSASTRSRRSRSTISCPGTAGALVRHGRLQPGLQVLPELGHHHVARGRHAGRRRVARADRARRPSGSAAAASPSPTTTRSSSSSTRSTRAVACRARGIKAVAVTAGYVCPEPRAELFASSTPRTSTSRRSATTSTARSAPGGSRPCSTPSSTCGTRRGAGSRSPVSSFRA